jgi:uncharacterized membrane protein YhdT
MLLDYILTYTGIYTGIITEANPLMVWLFSYPFAKGIMLRIITIVPVLIPFYILKSKGYRSYTKFINAACIIYSLVFILHLNWILRTFFIL